MPQISYQKYFALAGCFLFEYLIGTFYMWGTINPYVASYFNIFNSNVVQATTLVVNPIWLITQSCSAPISLILTTKFKIPNNIYLFTFSLIFALNNFACSFIHNTILFIALFSVINGFCIGQLYLLPIYTGWAFFPNHRSFVTGLILFNAGFSGFVLNYLSSFLCNPDHLIPVNGIFPSQVGENVPGMFRTLSYIYSGIAILAVACYRNPPTENGSKSHAEVKFERTDIIDKAHNTEKFFDPNTRYSDSIILDKTIMNNRSITSDGGFEEFSRKRRNAEKIIHEKIGYLGEGILLFNSKSHKDTMDIEDMINSAEKAEQNEDQESVESSKGFPNLFSSAMTYQFFFMCIMPVMSCSCLYLLSNIYKSYGETLGIGDSFLSIVGSLAALGNAFGRVIFGWLIGLFGFKKNYIGLILLEMLMLICIIFIENKFVYGIIIILVYAGIGMHLSGFPAGIVTIWGPKYGPSLYSIVYIMFGIADLAGYFEFIGLIQYIGYKNLFYFYLAIMIIPLIMIIIFNPNVKPKKRESPKTSLTKMG